MEPPGDHDVERRFADFVRQREAMAGGLDAGALGAGSRIGQLARNAGLHQRQFAARHAFAIERNAGLQRMRDVVGNMNVVAEQLLAEAIGEEAAADRATAVALKSPNICPTRSSTAAGSRITV